MTDDLSFDAKCIAGAWFGMMSPGKGDVTFQLQSTRPTDRALAALCELVENGIISVEPFNRYGGVVYRPLVDCRWGFDFLHKNIDDPAIRWPITEPIAGGDGEAKLVRKRALSARKSGSAK